MIKIHEILSVKIIRNVLGLNFALTICGHLDKINNMWSFRQN